MKTRSFELAQSAVAAILLSFGGYALWRPAAAEPEWARWQRAWNARANEGDVLRVREAAVAWRCATGDGGACNAVFQLERCTTCHLGTSAPHDVSGVDAPRVLREHPDRATLIDRHADLGCVACHGGDGLAIERAPAHDGLAALGDAMPTVQARCGSCHEATSPNRPSPAREAWTRWLETRDGKSLPPPPDKQPVMRDLASTLTLGRSLFGSLRCGACHDARRDVNDVATPLDTLALRSTSSELATSLANHALRSGFDLALDEADALSVAARLRVIEAPDAATALLHRASVPGSSAEEGRVLVEGLGCAGCHGPAQDDGRLHVELVPIAAVRTADWIAYYLADPRRANAAAMMPSLRLTAREAASIAQRLAPRPVADVPSLGAEVGCRVGGGSAHMTREACGESIITASRCVACHASKQDVPAAPSLARYGDNHDGTSVSAKLASHAGYHLDANQARALAIYLVSRVGTRVREDLRVPARDGDALYASLGCAGCHAVDDSAAQGVVSLFGEGLRVRPQWLFEFLRAPERHPVRPAFHPEQAYRDLVPADRVTRRMPTFSLGERELTSLARFFAERDGASFPYATSPNVVLAGDALTSAIGDVTHKDRGACLSCHSLGTPDVARAREEGDKLAPPLDLGHERLRAEWIEACIMQPEHWVSRMPAFVRPIAEIDRVRDLLLLLRERTILPPPGAEGALPALGLGDF